MKFQVFSGVSGSSRFSITTTAELHHQKCEYTKEKTYQGKDAWKIQLEEKWTPRNKQDVSWKCFMVWNKWMRSKVNKMSMKIVDTDGVQDTMPKYGILEYCIF